MKKRTIGLMVGGLLLVATPAIANLVATRAPAVKAKTTTSRPKAKTALSSRAESTLAKHWASGAAYEYTPTPNLGKSGVQGRSWTQRSSGQLKNADTEARVEQERIAAAKAEQARLAREAELARIAAQTAKLTQAKSSASRAVQRARSALSRAASANARRPRRFGEPVNAAYQTTAAALQRVEQLAQAVANETDPERAMMRLDQVIGAANEADRAADDVDRALNYASQQWVLYE